jgi:hypothetical protein
MSTITAEGQREKSVYFAAGYYGADMVFKLVKPAEAGQLPYVSHERNGSLRLITRHHANYYLFDGKDEAVLVWVGAEQQPDPPKTQKLTFEQKTELFQAIERGIFT